MFTKEKYIKRRNELKKLVKEGIVVMFGNSESPMNYTGNPYRFRQDSHMLYYFGLNYPDLLGVIDIHMKKALKIQFGQEQNQISKLWCC